MRYVRYICISLAIASLLAFIATTAATWNHGYVAGGHGHIAGINRYWFAYNYAPILISDPWGRASAKPYAAGQKIYYYYFWPQQHTVRGPTGTYKITTIPWPFALACTYATLAAIYFWAWTRDRKYVQRRRRLAAWRKSQSAFPVQVPTPSRPSQQQQASGQ